MVYYRQVQKRRSNPLLTLSHRERLINIVILVFIFKICIRTLFRRWVGLFQVNHFLFFRRCFIIKQELPINEQIRAKEVQLIDDQGEKRGVVSLNEALDIAFEKKLDLVLVAPNSQPPVCKIMNYGKYKFEQSKKEKEARKKQKTFEVKDESL